jgi:SAM-dependent methyltransferase
MILFQLIRRHLKHGDDEVFYRLQATDAMHWIQRHAGSGFADQQILDLGCGHGVFGEELIQTGADVTFADAADLRAQRLKASKFLQIDLDQQEAQTLGQFHGVVCSNVLEHLKHPDRLIQNMETLLAPGGWFYLSWTNWLSPWGGHEFSPFHYLGPQLGPKCFDRLTGKKRLHTPGENLFVTRIGKTLSAIKSRPELKVLACAPRYYPELAWITKAPLLREFFTWNCALLIQRV